MAVDLVLKNANLQTVDPSFSRRTVAGAVAVSGERIFAVGDAEDAEILTAPGTKTIDCQGMTLVPGFNDAHCHIFSFVRNQLSLDLSPRYVRSIADLKAVLKRRAAETPSGQWITGANYSDFHLAEKRHPTRWDIDEVTPDNPVVLAHRSLHACVLNSRALALAHINMETEEPAGGRIERDPETGEPTGVLIDMLGYIRYRVMPPMSDAELEQALRMANRHYVSCGITSLQDATITNEVRRWQVYRRFQEKGTLKSRIYLMTGIEQLPRFREAGLGFRAGDDRLRMGGLKIVLGETTGRLYPVPEDLNRYVLDCQRDGVQVAIHAVQPSTLAAALTAIESAQAAAPAPDRRHRIEHCAECPPGLFERVKRAGVIVANQPPFLYYSGERYLTQLPAETIPWLYRMRSLLEAGVTVAAGSDSPVAGNEPLTGICAAVTRQAADGRVVAPDERVTPAQAIAMYTIHAAYASFDEQVKGSVTPGKLADLALLSDDPTRVAPERIREIKVMMTMIGGEIVFQA